MDMDNNNNNNLFYTQITPSFWKSVTTDVICQLGTMTCTVDKSRCEIMTLNYDSTYVSKL